MIAIIVLIVVVVILAVVCGLQGCLLRGAYVRQKELMAEVEKYRTQTAVCNGVLDGIGSRKPSYFAIEKGRGCSYEVYAWYDMDSCERHYTHCAFLKSFADSDPEYNLNCANELKEKLEERV